MKDLRNCRRMMLAFCVWVCGIGTSWGLTKQWIPNTNLNNPKNWDVGRVPCANDRLKLAEEVPVVYIQTNMTISALTLPMNGEVVLGDGLSLAFGEDPSPPTGCGKDIKFTRTSPKDWLDPENWCTTDDATPGKCSQGPSQWGLLDTEKVPCMTDSVVFPGKSSYLVDLDTGMTLFVGKLSIGNKQYTTATLNSYLSTPVGSKQFMSDDGPPSRISIRDQVCNDVTGCVCGNDKGPIQNKICSLAKPRCVPANCTNALTAVGSCCPVCGAILQMEYGSGFKMSRIKQNIQNKYLNGKTAVSAILSRISDDVIQLVLSDSVGGDKAVDVGLAFKQEIQKDIKATQPKYGILNITLTTSGVPPSNQLPPKIAEQKGGDMSGGSIAGIILAIVGLLIIIAVIGFFVWRRRSGKPVLANGFSIFNNRQEKQNIELGMSVSFNDANGIEGDVSMRGFDNPMYDSPMSINNLKDVESFFHDPTEVDPHIKFNPVYTSEGVEEDSAI